MNNKKIIFQVTKRYMKLNRRRTLMTFFGIMLMVILMVCVFVGKNTVISYLGRVAEFDKGGWHNIVYDLSQDEADSLEGLGITKQTEYTEQYGLIAYTESGEVQLSSNLYIKAATPGLFDLFMIKPVEGRLPENDHEIVISKYIQDEICCPAIGDTISGTYFTRTITGCNENMKGQEDACTVFPGTSIKLHYGETIEVDDDFADHASNESFIVEKHYTDKTSEFTVVGFVDGPTMKIGGGYPAYTAVSDRSAMGSSINAAVKLDLSKVDGAQGFRNAVTEITGEEKVIETNELLYTLSFEGSDSVLRTAVIALMVFFVVFIAAASILLIYNVFSISYAERTKYLGMLSSIGATGRQKRSSVYYECAVLLVTALPFGILLGFGIIFAAVKALKPNLDVLVNAIQFGAAADVPITLSVRPADLAAAIVMCIVTVILSALIPAVKISRVGAVESIRGNTEKQKKGAKTRFSLLERCKPEKLLAVNGTKRNKHLTKGVVRSIAVLATLVTITLYGSQSAIKLIRNVADRQEFVPDYSGYEYYAASSDPAVYDTIFNELRNAEGVKELEERRMISSFVYIYGSAFTDSFYENFDELAYPTWDGTREEFEKYLEDDKKYTYPSNLLVLSDEEYAKIAEKKGAKYDLSVPSVMMVDEMKMDNSNFRFERDPEGYHAIDADNIFNTRPGGTIRLYLSNSKLRNDYDITVDALLKADDLSEYGTLEPRSFFGVLNEAAAAELEKNFDSSSDSGSGYSLMDKTLLFNLDENSSEVLDTLSALDRDYEEATIGKVDMLSTMMTVKMAIIAIIRIVAYCFTALISAVCLLNLYNSVKSRSLERSKETAVLRSVGMTDKQFAKMYRIETRLMLTKGMTIAAVVSAAVASAMTFAIKSHVGDIRLPFPWLTVLLIAAAIIGVTFLITGSCNRSADKESIIDEIRRGTV